MRNLFALGLILFTLTCHAKEITKQETTNVYANLKALSLEKSVKSALAKKPSVHAYQQNIQDAKRQRKATLSSYLPNVSLTEKIYNTKSASGVRSSFGISYSQKVIDLAQQSYFNIYTALLSLARHKKQSHEDTTRLNAETTFFDSWLLQQKLPLIMLEYKAAKANFETSKNQYKNNLLDKNDWLTARATFDSELATVNSFKDDIAEAEKKIEYYIGKEITLLPGGKNDPTKLSWAPTNKMKIKPLDEYYKLGLKHRKDLKEKQDTIDSEAHKSQYYLKQYIPNVSLFGTATKYTYRNANSGGFKKDAGIQFSWSVFDGLSNYFNKSAADARKLKTIFEKSDLRKQIKLEIQTAYTTLQKETKNLEAQTTSYTQAKNEFELRKKEFYAGLISRVEFETANYTYETARHTWLTQAAATALSKQSLLFACGYPQI